MKLFIPLYTFIFLFGSILNAQVNITKTWHEGKEVNIYPYRVKDNNYSTDNKLLAITGTIDIPYYPESLPDGEYIAYYPKTFHYNKKREKVILDGDTNNIAIHFYLKNGKKEGEAKWFTLSFKKKLIYQIGNYTNDLKTGEWHYYNADENKTYHYKNGLLDGEVIRVNNKTKINRRYNFSNGILHGKYSINEMKNGNLIELEFENGNISGHYHLIKYKTRLQRIPELNINYSGNGNFKYDRIEIKGNLNENLRYGKWEILLDNQKIEIVYDTMKTINERYNYYYYNSKNNFNNESYDTYEERDNYENEVFSKDLIRKQIYLNGFNDYQNVRAWEFSILLNNSTGYFTEYDKSGNIINADSFSNQAFKTPFAIKNFKEEIIAKYDNIKGTNIYLFEEKTYNAFTRKKYIRDNNLKILLESYSENKINKDSLFYYHRSIDYYKYHPIYANNIIMKDSTIRIGKNKIVNTYSHYIHIYSGYKYLKNFDYKNNKESIWEFDSINSTIKEVTRTNIGDLSLIDTAYYLLGAIRNILTDENYTYNYELKKRENQYQWIRDSMHNFILWKNKPYTGYISFDILYNEKKSNEESHEIIDKYSWIFDNSKTIKAKILSYNCYRIFGYSSSGIRPNKMELSVKDGRLTGQQSLYLKLKKVKEPLEIYSIKYGDNLKQGIETINYFEFYYKNRKTGKKRRYNYRERTPLFKHKPIGADLIYKEHNNYNDGKLEGVKIIKNNSGNVKYSAQFEAGKLNGEFIKFNSSEQIDVKFHFINDTLNGIYENYNDKNELIDIANFKNGELHGKYYKYEYQNLMDKSKNKELQDKNIRFCNERKVNTIELEFNNGYLVNTGKFFHCDGILKATINYDINDSIKLLEFTNMKECVYTKPYYDRRVKALTKNSSGSSFFRINKYSRDILNSQPTFSFDSKLPGYYRYFYKSGVQSQEGKINQIGMKTGWWKFWNENGVLMKEILYESGYILDPFRINDTIKYKGKIKSYYPNGKFMMEGYVLDENFKYECVQDEEIAYQNVYYLSFMDEKGNNILKNNSGIVRDYHINGNMREEGQWVNGMKNGLWKTYENNGKLKSIGYYKNNQKDGLWLTGDLSGIGFVDNQCFDGVIDLAKIKGNLNEKKLAFKEIQYINGVIIKSISHDVNLE